MEFISLLNTLASIAQKTEMGEYLSARCMNEQNGKISKEAARKFMFDKQVLIPDIKYDNSLYDKIQWARKVSYAAKTLNKALHDANFPLTWLEQDKQLGFAVESNEVRREAIELLTHASGRGNRLDEKVCTHFRNAITLGDDALLQPMECKPNEGLWFDEKPVRLQEIGFNKEQLTKFLVDNHINSDLTLEVPTSQAIATPVRRNKIRTNSLDAPITRAIEKAGSLDNGAVYLELREMALENVRPFTGETEKGALYYTNDAGDIAKLSKAALGKRLERKRSR